MKIVFLTSPKSGDYIDIDIIPQISVFQNRKIFSTLFLSLRHQFSKLSLKIIFVYQKIPIWRKAQIEWKITKLLACVPIILAQTLILKTNPKINKYG